jgi:hypothetical protein
MRGRKRERFKELCEISEIQNDPDKLAELASRINEVLKSEIEKLRKRPPKTKLGQKKD